MQDSDRAPAGRRGVRLLVVDDTAFMRWHLRRLLEQHGYRVVGEASNGWEAVEKYRELRPEVVTMDLTMPEMGGLAAVRAILREDPSARIVVLSAMRQKAIVMEAIRAGARDFVVKPFRPERLIEAIQRLAGEP